MTESIGSILTGVLVFLCLLVWRCASFAVRVWSAIDSSRAHKREVQAWRAEVSRLRREYVKVGEPPEKS
jgi:hypothetical protein